MDEISQLHCADVKLSPIPHLVVENLEDEDTALAKLLKNESSDRTIPIHNDLIEIGFFNYVDAIRQSGRTHLFPDLPHEWAEIAAVMPQEPLWRAFEIMERISLKLA